MSRQEELPELGGERWLNDIELHRFAEHVIWPAVDLSYEDDFRQEAAVGEWHRDTRSFESPDGESQLKVELSASIVEMNQDNELTVAQFCILVHSSYYTNKLVKRGEGGTVWVATSYIFEENQVPYLMRYLQLRDEFDEEVDEDDMGTYAHDLIYTTNCIEEESDDLTRTDCLEIYNGLLALGIPEHAMRYRDWEYGVG